jgi:hypothetical protein
VSLEEEPELADELDEPPALLPEVEAEDAEVVVAVVLVVVVSVSELLVVSVVEVVEVSSVVSVEVSKAIAFALLLVIVEARALASSEMETLSPDELELLVLLELVDAALMTDEEPELEDVESLYVESKLSMADIKTSFVTPPIGRLT